MSAKLDPDDCGHGMDRFTACGACFEDMKDRAEKAESEVERLRAVLLYISVGKQAADNVHPLGEYASMAMRFISTAQEAVRISTSAPPGGNGK